MRSVFAADFTEWRKLARQLLAAGIHPVTVMWNPPSGQQAREWIRAEFSRLVAGAPPSLCQWLLQRGGIDSVLALCPHEQGEERSEGTRILIVPPPAIIFEISDDDRRVTVLSVKETPPQI